MICCSTIDCNAGGNRSRATNKHRFVICNLYVVESNDRVTMIPLRETHQDSLSPVRVFAANSSKGYNSEMKTLSAISAIRWWYIDYCMLYYGALQVILNDVYDINIKIETVVGAKSGL